jgi:LysM repeat protein
MATKSVELQAEADGESILAAMERKPLPAALSRIAPIAEAEASTTRWVWIVAGVAVLFGLIIGGDYLLSHRGGAPVTAAVAPPTDARKPAPTVTVPLPTPNSTPQLSVNQPSASSQSAPDQAAMAQPAQPSPVTSSGQPLQPLSSEPAPVQEAQVPAAAQSPVPVLSQPPEAVVEHEPRYITIEEGQTLIWIAHANHVPAAAIAAANHLERPYALRAGSRLLIPDPNAQATSDKAPVAPPHPAHLKSGFEPH